MSYDGLVLLHKPAGITSFSCLYPIKRCLGKKVKVGHTGTLDLFAEGLMVVLVGKATKLNGHFTNLNKEYIATLVFGSETDTLDPSGQVVQQTALPNLSTFNLDNVVASFIGEQQQIPPVYSAIKIGGIRASDRTRDGQQVQMESRTIHLYSIEIMNYLAKENLLKELKLKITCSKGTYIRSVARDIAYAMHSCGHLKNLVRTKVGSFNLDDAVKAENFNVETDVLALNTLKLE